MKLFKLLCLIVTINLNAQESRFKEGETVNIWAQSGLNMRDKPDAKAPKLTTIPYGAKVIVQLNIGVKIPFEVEEFKGFIVKGYWLLVKYGNTEGFVFDGFLSRLPAPNEVDISTYLDKEIGKKGDKFIYDKTKKLLDEIDFNSLSQKKFNKDSGCAYYQKYNYDIFYADLCPETTFYYVYQIPNITLYEGYCLMTKWDKNVYVRKEVSYDKNTKTISIDTIDENGCGQGTSIKLKANKVNITIGGGC